MLDSYVGRQPVYDGMLNIIGYELLFRSFGADRATFVDGDRATSITILNTFMEIGLENIVGKRLAFVNLTRNFIIGRHPLPFPPDQVVLEVLEDITIDEELIDAVKSLNAAGYRIALDDVVQLDRVAPLLPFVHIIKLDIKEMDQTRLPEHIGALRRYPLKLMAEKVETLEELTRCRELGMHYFQGYFLSKPTVVQGKRLSVARINLLQLLAQLQNPDVNYRQLEELIRLDVALSYKLLRLTNSALYSKSKKIESIGGALAYLGLRQIQSWVSLLLVSQIDGKPSELMKIAIVRAKMCENLAQSTKERHFGPDFTVGLFSALDALFDRPLTEILASLPLSEEIVTALLEHQGPMGIALHCTLAYEQGRWDEAIVPGLHPTVIRKAYLEGVTWAEQVLSSVIAA